MKNDDTDDIKDGRRFLRSGWEGLEGFESDQRRGVPVPAVQKACVFADAEVSLPPAAGLRLGEVPLSRLLAERRSRRNFSARPLALEEISYLLWATQGVVRRLPGNSLRTVPSAGARHSFETYVYASRIEGLSPALYRYAPFDHTLCRIREGAGLSDRIREGLMGQDFGAAARFVWTSVPYRMEWRYGPVSHKLIALDAGHVCQNLYLACESIGCGACAVGAYDQDLLDEAIGVDGRDELSVYAALVGKL